MELMHDSAVLLSWKLASQVEAAAGRGHCCDTGPGTLCACRVSCACPRGDFLRTRLFSPCVQEHFPLITTDQALSVFRVQSRLRRDRVKGYGPGHQRRDYFSCGIRPNIYKYKEVTSLSSLTVHCLPLCSVSLKSPATPTQMSLKSQLRCLLLSLGCICHHWLPVIPCISLPQHSTNRTFVFNLYLRICLLILEREKGGK